MPIDEYITARGGYEGGEVITRDSVLRDPARSHDFCGGNLIALAPETVGSRPGEAVGSESEGRWG